MDHAIQDVVDYYHCLTKSYLKYAQGANGWHYGIWEPGIRTHPEALVQSNRVLLRDIGIRPETRILDVGCGVGGLAVWAAAEFGCRVTGITVVPLHAILAWQLAARRGVGDLCEFVVMDMSSMTFPEESFDVVVNQETMCHAVDKGQYLKDVNRILRPGGMWRAIEFSAGDKILDRSDDLYRTVREDWYIPSLLSAAEVKRLLEEANFQHAVTRDLTQLVSPTARGIIRGTYLHVCLARLGLDWLVHSRDPERRKFYRGHVRAGVAYSRGLLDGHFRHNLYGAVKGTLPVREPVRC